MENTPSNQKSQEKKDKSYQKMEEVKNSQEKPNEMSAEDTADQVVVKGSGDEKQLNQDL